SCRSKHIIHSCRERPAALSTVHFQLPSGQPIHRNAARITPQVVDGRHHAALHSHDTAVTTRAAGWRFGAVARHDSTISCTFAAARGGKGRPSRGRYYAATRGHRGGALDW